MSRFTVEGPLRWIAVTVVLAAAAVPLSFVLWPTPIGVATPPASIVPFLIPIAVVIPALSLGFGVAFLLFGSRLLPTAGPTALSRAAFVSIVWLLVNWWPHSNFHRVANGWTNIVLVDYFFHTTVIVATCVVAAYFMSVLRQRRAVDEMQSDARHMAPTLTT
jgi:hypothetical protein